MSNEETITQIVRDSGSGTLELTLPKAICELKRISKGSLVEFKIVKITSPYGEEGEKEEKGETE